MKPLSEEAVAALAPVRAALHEAARREAEEIVASAEAEAEEVLASARATAERLIRDAEAQGAATARAATAMRSARARREATEMVLAEQEAVRRELERRVVRAVADLAADPRHATWLERLAARCHEALGPDATVTPSPSGGVVGELGSRRIDLSVPVLAAAMLEEHGAEVRTLWTA